MAFKSRTLNEIAVGTGSLRTAPWRPLTFTSQEAGKMQPEGGSCLGGRQRIRRECCCGSSIREMFLAERTNQVCHARQRKGPANGD